MNSLIAVTNPDPFRYGWWLTSRAAGITALLFVTASTVLGLTMASGIIQKRGLKAKLMPAHEYLALFSIAAIAVHGLSLLGDKWMKASITNLLVPGTISYRPFWVAIGIISGYITVLLALSFYGRKYIGVRRWRMVHRFIVVVWILGVVHALGAGTDAGTLWLRLVLLASVAPAMFLTLYRWLPEDNRDRDISAPGTHGDTVIVHPHEQAGHSHPQPPARRQVVIPDPAAGHRNRRSAQTPAVKRAKVTVPDPAAERRR
jgi:sulfoxide reductase heme-binding subunit YedZ